MKMCVNCVALWYKSGYIVRNNMDTRKDTIATAFGRAVRTYAVHALPQKQAGKKLINIVQQYVSTCESVLDIGSGTGVLIEDIKQLYPGITYYCNDIALPMLEYIYRHHAASVRYCYGDVEHIMLPTVTLAVANFVFQWVYELPRLLCKVMQTTSTLGFTILLEGTFASWRALCQEYTIPCRLHQYPSFSALYDMLMQLPYPVVYTEEEKIPLACASPKAFVQHLRNIGATTVFATQKGAHEKIAHGALSSSIVVDELYKNSVPVSKEETLLNGSVVSAYKALLRDTTPFETEYNVAYVVLSKKV